MTWTQEQATAYAAANPDVMKAFQSGGLNNGDTNLASAMQAHYDWAGQKEGRAAPTTQPAPTNPPLGNGTQTQYDKFQSQFQGKVFDLNGNPLTLPSGYTFGGPEMANVIFNDKGQGVGQYYTSPEAAAREKASKQAAMSNTNGIVAGPQTPAQQAAGIQNSLNNGGLSSGLNAAMSGGTTGGTSFPNVSGAPSNGAPGSNGLVGNYMSNFSSTAGQATTTPWNVNSDQTVLGQMQKVTADNSPLIQSARTGALQQANSRGLINSSLALGAADLAAYEAALPIAQADAGAYGNAAKTNAAAENSTSQFNASGMNALQTANLSADTQKALQAMSGENALKVAELNKQYSQVLQGSQSASTLYRNYSDQILAIYQDTNMSDVAKQNAVDNLTNTFATGLSLISSIDKIDLTAFLS